MKCRICIICFSIVVVLLCFVLFLKMDFRHDKTNIKNTVDNSIAFWEIEEVYAAMDVVESYFFSDDLFQKCELNEIRYTIYEDNISYEYYQSSMYGQEKIMVLSTDFTTGILSINDGFNPNSDYTYIWILVEKDDEWEILSYGMP